MPQESQLTKLLLAAAYGMAWFSAREKRLQLIAPEGPVVVSPVPDSSWPRAGRMLAFGTKRTETHTHQGVDFMAPRGTPVYAARGGYVSHAITKVRRGFSGYGKAVVIACEATSVTPEFWCMYAHLDEVFVTTGQQVQTGEQIGTVGKTCYRLEDPTHMCGGYHLHFEISPRPYPQGAETWRYDPGQMLSALYTGKEPDSWITT